uniref:Peptidase A2 domain-containing protein n=1 Tax=Trichogramma kaykai TaxID=54128 RepID=A0ABD2XHF0_9HYME
MVEENAQMALEALLARELVEDGQNQLVDLDEGGKQLWLELGPRVDQLNPGAASTGGEEYIALLDPGANITGIHARVAEKFPDRLESKEGWIGGAARGATRTTGELPLTITVDNTTDRIKAHVVPTFNHDIILGMDFMLKFDVDLRNGRYLWRARGGPWHSSKLDEVD